MLLLLLRCTTDGSDDSDIEATLSWARSARSAKEPHLLPIKPRANPFPVFLSSEFRFDPKRHHR